LSDDAGDEGGQVAACVEVSRQSSAPRRFDVAWLVADHEAARKIGRPFRQGAPYHSGVRLAVGVICNAILLDRSVRMERAVIEGVDMGASLGELVLHVGVEGDDGLFVVEPAR